MASDAQHGKDRSRAAQLDHQSRSNREFRLCPGRMYAYMLRRQKNTRIQAATTVAVIATGFWLRLEADKWALLVLAITSVWITEFINAAIEAAVNLYGTDYHPMAQVAKDVAAGAALISAIGALLIGVLILLPPILAAIQIGGASR